MLSDFSLVNTYTIDFLFTVTCHRVTYKSIRDSDIGNRKYWFIDWALEQRNSEVKYNSSTIYSAIQFINDARVFIIAIIFLQKRNLNELDRKQFIFYKITFVCVYNVYIVTLPSKLHSSFAICFCCWIRILSSRSVFRNCRAAFMRDWIIIHSLVRA